MSKRDLNTLKAMSKRTFNTLKTMSKRNLNTLKAMKLSTQSLSPRLAICRNCNISNFFFKCFYNFKSIQMNNI